MEQVMTVNGMKCEGCANTVKDKLSAIETVASVKIDLENKTATVESARGISEETADSSLKDTHYSIEKRQ
ncbi:heavy-metal-associated domain-containing protein [Marinilactibacillus piezotolerans]|uniref:heavy-metal-associated domain-containing protein n=1 Tax=Marinilactibacillus piezotolerans TaxID=258723 RepID=UPI0009B0B704|nr:heavy metal-associated domain-containing protein [Marinilactibacillus piezotolerans]